MCIPPWVLIVGTVVVILLVFYGIMVLRAGLGMWR